MKLFFALMLTLSFAPLVAQSNPKPLKIYSKDGISVNGYDFSSFESLLNTANDTIYVVNFWATWCAPCIKELPHFEKIGADYAEKKVKVILVSLDLAKQVDNQLLPFIKRKQLKSSVIHLNDPDMNTWIPKVDPTWSGAIPATLIFDKDNRQFYEKSFTYESLKQEIHQFIK